jgi:hypothetical protein
MTKNVLTTTEAAAELEISAYYLMKLVQTKQVARPRYTFGRAFAWLPGEISAIKAMLAKRQAKRRQVREMAEV